MRLRVAGARIPVGPNPEENADWIERGLETARTDSADLLITPEGAISGYQADGDREAIERAVDRVVARARELGVALALGVCLPGGPGEASNEVRIYASNGALVTSQRKILLCGPGPNVQMDFDEARAFQRGDSAKPFELAGARVGVLICNDLWANPLYSYGGDPQLATQLATAGAQLIIHVANTGFGIGPTNRPDDAATHFAFHETNLRLRARAAGVPIATVDCADPEGKVPTNCPSGVIAADGEWLTRAPATGPAFFTQEILLGKRELSSNA